MSPGNHLRIPTQGKQIKNKTNGTQFSSGATMDKVPRHAYKRAWLTWGSKSSRRMSGLSVYRDGDRLLSRGNIFRAFGCAREIEIVLH
jgi:hypothetical protein